VVYSKRPFGGPKEVLRYLARYMCEAVYQKIGLSRAESAALVELVLKEITDCLERGETVKLSSFGAFVVAQEGATYRPQSQNRHGSANLAATGYGVQAVSDSQAAHQRGSDGHACRCPLRRAATKSSLSRPKPIPPQSASYSKVAVSQTRPCMASTAAAGRAAG
jgi:hypothetical protein